LIDSVNLVKTTDHAGNRPSQSPSVTDCYAFTISIAIIAPRSPSFIRQHKELRYYSQSIQMSMIFRGGVNIGPVSLRIQDQGLFNSDVDQWLWLPSDSIAKMVIMVLAKRPKSGSF